VIRDNIARILALIEGLRGARLARFLRRAPTASYDRCAV